MQKTPKIGSLLGGKYRIDAICSNSGGMGTVLSVTDIYSDGQPQLALKYCKRTDAASIKRFKREVRLLRQYSGNSKVVQILDHDLTHSPPFYVMQRYELGDASGLTSTVKDDLVKQEAVVKQLIACVAEVHQLGHLHRDIKPENFLVSEDSLLISDFGLGQEVGSITSFTTTREAWGTEGYVPPEFYDGGFRNAEVTSDIFMLGKTFYAVITGRPPQYFSEQGIPAAIFNILQKCCHIERGRRYQSLADLLQSLDAAYDVILDRVNGLSKARSVLLSIEKNLEADNSYDIEEVSEFLNAALLLESDERSVIFQELPKSFYEVVTQEPFKDSLKGFIESYGEMVYKEAYSWSFAETIAFYMQSVVRSKQASDTLKAEAVRQAIYAAETRNRYAAMDVCRAVVRTTSDGPFALLLREIIKDNAETFISSIEASTCESDIIASALKDL